MMKFGILTGVILFLLIPSIMSNIGELKCFVCNSNFDEGCDYDPVPEVYIVQCNATDKPQCRRIVQTVDEQVSVVRACGSTAGEKSCYKTAGRNNAQVCSCDHNLCNHATTLNRQEQRLMTMISSIIVLGITMTLIG